MDLGMLEVEVAVVPVVLLVRLGLWWLQAILLLLVLAQLAAMVETLHVLVFPALAAAVAEHIRAAQPTVVDLGVVLARRLHT